MANISGQMDEIFDSGLDFDVIFDKEDKLIDTVNGVKEDGSSLLGDEYDGLFDENGEFIGESDVSIPGEPSTDDGKADNTAGKAQLLNRTADTKNDVKDQSLNRDAESDGTSAAPQSDMANVDDTESPNEFKKDLGYTKENGELSRIEECMILYENTNDEKYLDQMKELIKESYVISNIDRIEEVEEAADVTVADTSEDLTDAQQVAKEAVEAWYAENGKEITDYDRGRIDMFVRHITEAEDVSAPDEPDTDDGKNQEPANNSAAKTTMSNGQNEQKPDDNTSVGEGYVDMDDLVDAYIESRIESLDESVKSKIRKAKKAVKKGQKKAKRAIKKVDKLKNKADKLADLAGLKEAIEDWYNENEFEFNDYEAGRVDLFIETQAVAAIEADVVDEADELERELFDESLFNEAGKVDDIEDDIEDDLIGDIENNSSKSGKTGDLEYEAGEDDVIIDQLLN